MLIDDGRIAWVGDDEGASSLSLAGVAVTELDGALLTPGFVDAHVHATSTGLTILGLDLSSARSAKELLDAVAQETSARPGTLILGHGWDETSWNVPTLPTRAHIDRASEGARVYLTRVDAHSALVSSALIVAVPESRSMRGFDDSGWVTQEAHHALREHALGTLDFATTARAQEAFLARAAKCGIVSVHEMAGPVISSADDLVELLARATNGGGTQVVAYWGELAQCGGIDTAREIGAHTAGGDLFVDGSFGSHTACLHEPYADDSDTFGREFIDLGSLTEHVDMCVRADQQTGFHAIGDSATEAVVSAYARAAQVHGVNRLVAQRHRIEHAESMSAASIHKCAQLGVFASMQPVFDERWGGIHGMYAQRLGPERAAMLNVLADMERSGLRVAFGSDAPVTPLDPWGAVRAALHHRTPAQRLSLDAAIGAHTRVGWQAAGIDDAGRLDVGAMAHLAIWAQVPVDEIPQSGSTSLRTIVAGAVAWDSGHLEDISC